MIALKERLLSSSSLSASSTFPRGLVGEIAQFIYDAAPRPVHEIALAGAIGLMAGITGRAYNVSGTGLNQYVLAIAPTGFGKEAIATGISKLVKATAQSVPAILEFVGPTEVASPQALIKWLARTPCIYSIVGEFGLKLKEMSNPHAPAHIAGLKRTLLDLYHKSGDGATMGAMAYSKREDNTAIISSPSFTLIGESTPEKFFENINEDVVTDGLLPRFSVIEYTGALSKLNKKHSDEVPSQELIGRIAELSAHALSLTSRSQIQIVAVDAKAEAVFDAFNEFCFAEVGNRNKSSAGRELWNRAHLKAMKLAGLYAVGCNYVNPCIDEEQARSACDEIYEQTKSLKAKFESGDVGAVAGNETKQLQAVNRVIDEYVKSSWEKKYYSYGVTEAMHRDRIFTATMLQRRLADTAAFRVPGGGSRAVNECLKQKKEGGEILEISLTQMQKDYGVRCRAFALYGAELHDEINRSTVSNPNNIQFFK